MILFHILNIISKPFTLKLGKFYLGVIDELPALVDKEHAAFFDTKTYKSNEDDDSKKGTLCTEMKCLYQEDYHLFYSEEHSTKFDIYRNSDETISYKYDGLCMIKKDRQIKLGKCGKDDKFKKIFVTSKKFVENTDDEENEDNNTLSNTYFNYGVEDTDHKRDSIIQMRKEDENYTLTPVNRHHNSHVHRVGGFGDKAYYTYYSYHPSSRHSMYNFHGSHHGIPKSWNDDLPNFAF